MRTTEERDERTNLGSSRSRERRDIIPVEVRARELREDELPEVLEQRGIGDVAAVGSLVRSTCDQAHELAVRRDDESARIATLGERPNLTFMGEDGELERLQGTGGEVRPDEGHEAMESSDGSVGHETALQDATNAIAVRVESVGTLDLLGRQHTSKLEKTMLRIFELRGNVSALVHEALEVGLVDLGSWKRKEKE